MHRLKLPSGFSFFKLQNRLDWRLSSEAFNKKGQSRMDFLMKLRSFSVCSKMLQIFDKFVIERVDSSAVIFWCSSIRTRDFNRLNNQIKKAGDLWSNGGETWII